MENLLMPYYLEFNAVPVNIGTPALWLAASAFNTLYTDSSGSTQVSADGDPVGMWFDRSGNGRHATQASGISKPTYKTNIFNGKSVVRFNGTNSLMNFVSPDLGLTGLTGTTGFLVTRSTTASGNCSTILSGPNNTVRMQYYNNNFFN
jgi:hypothetical protein